MRGMQRMSVLEFWYEFASTYSYPAAAGQMTFAVGDRQQPAELKLSQNGRESQAVRIAEISGPRIDANASRDEYVGWYELAPNRVLAVTRDADRIYVQETGRAKFRVAAQGADAFSSQHDDLVVFLRDGQAKVTQVLLQEPVSGARLAPRIDIAKARMVEERFARRIAEVPDRFRGQAPLPGSKEAVLRGIADLQRGIRHRKRAHEALFEKVIADGQREGAFRPGSVRLMVLALLGMCNWVYKWLNPDAADQATVDGIAAEFALMVESGIGSGDRRSGAWPRFANLDEAFEPAERSVKRTRAELERLESELAEARERLRDGLAGSGLRAVPAPTDPSPRTPRKRGQR